MEGYITQHVDLLNLRFLDMDRDGRQKSISIMTKRFAEKNKEYLTLEQEVTAAARRHQCSTWSKRISYIGWSKMTKNTMARLRQQ